MLKVKELCKAHGTDKSTTQVLIDASLEMETGSSVSIQGPSGCGKSTLLHLIAALDSPDAGYIEFTPHTQVTMPIHQFSEKEADAFRRGYLGIVFQKFNLIDCISVKENITLPARLNKNVDEEFIAMLIHVLGIERHINKLPTELSGGEQQRVAIARALAHKPQLLLADEPTGNLDEENSNIVSELLYRTCRELNTALIVVTHSPRVANLAARQLHMQHKKLHEIA